MPRCEGCNSRASSTDDTCPVCGEEIVLHSAPRKSPKRKKSGKPKPAAGPNMLVVGGIGGGFLVLMIVLIVVLLNRAPVEVPAEKPALVEQKVEPPVIAPAPAPPPVAAVEPPPEDELNLKGIEERIRAQGNLRQMGLAVHIFHDTFNRFPPEVNAQNPNPAQGMSWMTGLLPYVGQAQVDQLISKGEAWNAPANLQANQSVIPSFLHKPGVNDRDANGFGVANYAGNNHVFGTGQRIGFRDFLDGTSNTFIAGSVAAGYKPWADPGNVRDIKNGINDGPLGFGMPDQDRALILMADGSVREVSSTISPQVLEGISLPADGKYEIGGF